MEEVAAELQDALSAVQSALNKVQAQTEDPAWAAVKDALKAHGWGVLPTPEAEIPSEEITNTTEA